jgi:hypothetical protein
LAEVKHQGELKLQHPELPAHGRVLQTKHWKSRWATTSMLPPSTGLPDHCPMSPTSCHTPAHCQLLSQAAARHPAGPHPLAH